MIFKDHCTGHLSCFLGKLKTSVNKAKCGAFHCASLHLLCCFLFKVARFTVPGAAGAHTYCACIVFDELFLFIPVLNTLQFLLHFLLTNLTL